MAPSKVNSSKAALPPAREPSGRPRKQTEKENYRMTFQQEEADCRAANMQRIKQRQERQRRAAEASDDDNTDAAPARLCKEPGTENEDEEEYDDREDIDEDSDEDTQPSRRRGYAELFTSRTVISKPSSIKQLTQTRRRIPETPQVLQSSTNISGTNGDYQSSRNSVRRSLVSPRSRAAPGAQDKQGGHQDSRTNKGIEANDKDDNDNESMDELDYSYHTGDKRPRPTGEDLHEATTDGQNLKAQKIHENQGGRPRAKDYDNVTQEVLHNAIAIYCCKISTDVPFPDLSQETEFAKYAWKKGCEKAELVMQTTPEVMKMITARGSQVRGELKTKVRPFVEAAYGFDSGRDKKTIKRNRQLAEDLKENYGFVYKTHPSNPSTRTGLYQNKIIQKVVNAMWFMNKHDEGVVYHAYFKPFPISALALVLTAIECAIDEWSTGIKIDLAFNSNDYRPIYEAHHRCLTHFSAHGKAGGVDILDKICTKIHNIGRFHSGAQPIAPENIAAVNVNEFDAAIQEYKEDSATEDDGEEGDLDEE